jgi:hypothetical protein
MIIIGNAAVTTAARLIDSLFENNLYNSATIHKTFGHHEYLEPDQDNQD